MINVTVYQHFAADARRKTKKRDPRMPRLDLRPWSHYHFSANMPLRKTGSTLQKCRYLGWHVQLWEGIHCALSECACHAFAGVEPWTPSKKSGIATLGTGTHAAVARAARAHTDTHMHARMPAHTNIQCHILRGCTCACERDPCPHLSCAHKHTCKLTPVTCIHASTQVRTMVMRAIRDLLYIRHQFCWPLH